MVDLDIPRLLSGLAPRWASKTACAILGIGLAVVLRLIVERITPGAAPFAFVYPAALLATLAGRMAGRRRHAGGHRVAGLDVRGAQNRAAGHTHRPASGRRHSGGPHGRRRDRGRAKAFASPHRRSWPSATPSSPSANCFFRELQHRVNNDFTIVNSLLDLQRRRSTDPETRHALEQAMGRIRSVARVHHHLYTLPDIGAIDFRQYLADLCTALAQAAFPPTGLHLRCHCDEAYMPRSRAIAVGLVTNELVTNAVKHAFPNDREGNIDVRFQKTEAGWSLSVTRRRRRPDPGPAQARSGHQPVGGIRPSGRRHAFP